MALTVTPTYNDDFGRVQVAFSGTSVDVDYAKVEHSLDQITWETIRGGDTVPVSGGSGHVDHYDGYVFGVPNYYRVSAVDAALTPTFIAAGTAATGNNASVVPAHPAGLAVGHLKLILASIRNSGAGSVGVPAGWTKVAESGNVALLARIHQSGDTAPTVTFTGGVANADTLAQMACFANAKDVPNGIQTQLNPTDQNVAFPAIVLRGSSMLLYLGWKQDDFTSSATPTFATKIGDFVATAGDDAGMFWDYFSVPAINEGVTFAAQNVTITGGATAISRAIAVQFPVVDYLERASGSLTPALPNANIKPYWFMNPQRPGQNFRAEVVGFSEITTDSRTGVMEVLGRSYPVVVSDVMASDSLSVSIDAVNRREALEISQRFALGEPMYLLAADPNDDLGTFYFSVLSMKRSADTLRGSWTVTVDVRLVAQPSPSVYGSTYIWADVVSDYATWADVIAGVATWSNLVDKVSDDVIVVP